MTELTTLQNKDPREAARVLVALSNSLLPHPGIGEASTQPVLDSGVLESVLTEIRHRLKVRQDDFSVTAQSKIFAFVSQEISKAALASTNEKSIKDRLGNKGELRPSEYQIIINEENTKIIEALGNKRSHVFEALTHPDEVLHLQASYTADDSDLRHIRPTLSIKSVNGKRAEDDFILLVLSFRKGQIQHVEAAFRVYISEADVRGIRNPDAVLKAFVQTYGLTFQLGNTVSKYIENELLGVTPFDKHDFYRHMQPLEGSTGDRYYPVFAGSETRVQALHSEAITLRVLFAFVVNISKYAISMRRHKVQLTPEENWKFYTI